ELGEAHVFQGGRLRDGAAGLLDGPGEAQASLEALAPRLLVTVATHVLLSFLMALAAATQAACGVLCLPVIASAQQDSSVMILYLLMPTFLTTSIIRRSQRALGYFFLTTSLAAISSSSAVILAIGPPAETCRDMHPT